MPFPYEVFGSVGSGLTPGFGRGAFEWNAPILLGSESFIKPQMVMHFDDFIMKTGEYTTTVEADGTAQSTAALATGDSGVLALTLGAVANDFANVATGRFFSTGQLGLFEVRLKVAGAPDNLFVGMASAQTASNGNFVTNLATPAIAVADALGFGYEKANGGDKWFACSAKNSTDAAVALTPTVSATYQKLAVLMDASGNAQFFINDERVASVASAVRASQTLAFVIASTNVAGTITPVISVDYIFIAQARS